MVIKEKLITADEFWQMILKGEIDEKGTELIEGILHPMPPTGWEHGNIASELDMIIRMFVKKHKLGKTTAAETGFRLEKYVVVAPDVAFIRADRIPDEIPQGFVPFKAFLEAYYTSTTLRTLSSVRDYGTTCPDITN